MSFWHVGLWRDSSVSHAFLFFCFIRYSLGLKISWWPSGQLPTTNPMSLLRLLKIIQTLLRLLITLIPINSMQTLWQRVIIDKVLIIEFRIRIASLLLIEHNLWIQNTPINLVLPHWHFRVPQRLILHLPTSVLINETHLINKVRVSAICIQIYLSYKP